MLDVKIEVPPSSLGQTRFSLTDWAGQKNYAEDIYRVSAFDKRGKSIAVEKSGERTWIVKNAKKAFELTYEVVSRKDSFMGNSEHNQFHPTIFKDYAFLWGNTFLFYPDDPVVSVLPVRIRINPNEYGNFYTNLDGRAGSFEDLHGLFIAAGDYRFLQKAIGGKNVRFLIQGKNWKFTDEEFVSTVSGIIEAQNRYMGFSPSRDNLLITLNEGTRNSKGGTVVKNVISVYPDPQTGLKDFETLKLIAHENFHFWNGIYWHGAKGQREGYYKWMSEGFTDFYAVLTLYREKLITEKEFVGWLNNLLLEYQTNPVALTATADILVEKYWTSDDYNHLPYSKGALIAFLTDLNIRQRTGGRKQIDDLMRLLMSTTNAQKGYDDTLLLAGLDAITQTSNRQFYDAYILGAKFLPITEILKNFGIAVSLRQREVFDLGFSTETGRIERGVHIKEIFSENAIKAGVKAGDEIRAASILNGRPQEESSLTIRRGGDNFQIKYFPKKTINVWQINEDAELPR